MLETKAKQRKDEDMRHMQTYMHQKQDRDSLLNKYQTLDNEKHRANSEFMKRLNGRLSDADNRRRDHLHSTSKKQRDHCNYVNDRRKYQAQVDMENFEENFGQKINKAIETEKKKKNQAEERQAIFNAEMTMKAEKMEKVNFNKDKEQNKMKQKRTFVAKKDIEIANKLSNAKIKTALELKKTVEIKRLQTLDNGENRERDKMITMMKHQAYFDKQRRQEENFKAFVGECRDIQNASYLSI